MRLQASDVVSREWLSKIIWILLEDEEHEYAFTFHNVDVVSTSKPFMLCSGLPVPAAVGISTDLQIRLLVFYPMISSLSNQSQIAVIKHELLHIIEGHMSSYGARLDTEYGRQVSNIAKDLYVNQRLTDTEIKGMAEDGYPLETIKYYGFKPGLSSEEYCRLLQDGVSNGTINLPSMVMQPYQDGDVPPSGGGGAGQDTEGTFGPTEVFDLDEKDASTADRVTQDVLQRVTDTLKALGKSWRSKRGFQGADHDAFVKASERKSKVPWYYYLRVMESKNRAEVTVPTRRRPSRRCPFHLGRVRRYGLDVAFMIDTSGSMGPEQLSLVDAELRGMHSRGAHIRVIHCDASVAKIEEYSPFTPMERFYGRGGTDFSPALLEVRNMYPRPGLFVGYTDGAGGIEAYVKVIVEQFGSTWYEEFAARQPSMTPDGIAALWLIPEGCMEPDLFKKSIVPWGQVLVVPTDSVQER